MNCRTVQYSCIAYSSCIEAVRCIVNNVGSNTLAIPVKTDVLPSDFLSFIKVFAIKLIQNIKICKILQLPLKVSYKRDEPTQAIC